MTNKEAIEVIKLAIAEVEWEYSMEYAVAFEKAIEALEKQSPQKIKIIKEEPCCPVCNRPVLEFHTYPTGCPHCLQKLDWSE